MKLVLIFIASCLLFTACSPSESYSDKRLREQEEAYAKRVKYDKCFRAARRDKSIDVDKCAKE